MRPENCTIDHSLKPKELVGRHGSVKIENLWCGPVVGDSDTLFIYTPENPEFTGYYERVQCVAYGNTPFEAAFGPFKTVEDLEKGVIAA